MRLIGLAIVLAVSLTLAPLAAEAQPAGKSLDWATSLSDRRLPGASRRCV